LAPVSGSADPLKRRVRLIAARSSLSIKPLAPSFWGIADLRWRKNFTFQEL